ncbi:MAG: ADP-ribosylglycohydrolase family protein [Kocuria sp.]|nr:ADP-ribosylglycohydrolase family protein [Kocuria sp.]
MSDSSPSQLLSPDHGISTAAETYRGTVRAVFGSLDVATLAGGAGPGEAVQLAARAADALNEVAEWANDGLSADPTACAWLSYLRWARASGARPPANSPVPPTREFDDDFPVLSSPATPTGDSFTALATGEFGEVARPIDPATNGPEVLTRSIPYGLIPNFGWKALVPIVVDSAAITHGDPEAQTAAAATALAVHASARARETASSFQDVLAAVIDVSTGMTRPAPQTHALLRMVPQVTDPAALASDDGAFSRAVADGTTASSALALGLASVLVAQAQNDGPEDSQGLMSRALNLVKTHSADSAPARSVAAAVIAARWGTSALPSGDTVLRGELETLAHQWLKRWCP